MQTSASHNPTNYSIYVFVLLLYSVISVLLLYATDNHYNYLIWYKNY